MSGVELFRAGKLDEAIEAAASEVKKAPTKVEARSLLCELLCFRSDFERADKQLDLIEKQDPSSGSGIALFRQLIRAAVARQQFFLEGRLPEFLAPLSPLVKAHLEAVVLVREDEPNQAHDRLAEAMEKRTPQSGLCDEVPFDDFRDWDDLTSCVFEVLTSNGKYYWIPMESVELLELHPIKHPRDILWRSAHMKVSNGPDGEVHIPSLYIGSSDSDDDQLRLGRAADWQGEHDEPSRGRGTRTFMVGDENKTMMDMQRIEMNIA